MIMNFVRNYCVQSRFFSNENVLANVFNEVVAVALLHFEGRWNVHFLDLATRFSTASLVERLNSTDFSHLYICVWRTKIFINDGSNFFKNNIFKSLYHTSKIVFVSASAKGSSRLHDSILYE